MKQVILVGDLGYGDAGKGSIVDFLVRELQAGVVVRYNGGAQAAHNVVDPSGTHHTFSQFGSGTLTPGVRTHLSRFMLVDPLSMFREEQHLQALGITDAFSRTTIDREALVVTPYHQALNRLREIARGSERHGSCGMGIGETMSDYVVHGSQALFIGDLREPAQMKRKLQFLCELKLAGLQTIRDKLPDTETVSRELRVLEDPSLMDLVVDRYCQFARQVDIVEPEFLGHLLAQDTVIGEGSQGILLDEWYGFHPYTTWSTTTFRNADTLLQEQQYDGCVVRVGALRVYATRHGPGPFVTEDMALTAALPDLHNRTNPWQLTMRIGYFDAVAARYAIAVAGQVDLLAVTHLDRLRDMEEWRIADRYKYCGSPSGLDDYFALQDGAIADIKVGGFQDLVRQEQLTLRLQHCVPKYQVHPKITKSMSETDVAAFLVQIEQQLGVPVGIVSQGPTALDKGFTENWVRHMGNADLVPQSLSQTIAGLEEIESRIPAS
jgi:adenylosuccinate synthase